MGRAKRPWGNKAKWKRIKPKREKQPPPFYFERLGTCRVCGGPVELHAGHLSRYTSLCSCAYGCSNYSDKAEANRARFALEGRSWWRRLSDWVGTWTRAEEESG